MNPLGRVATASAALCLLAMTTACVPEAKAQLSPTEQAALDAGVSDYAQLLSATLEGKDSTAKTNEMRIAEESFGYMRSTYRNAGMKIADSQVVVTVRDATMQNGQIVAKVEVAATMVTRESGNKATEESEFTEPHQLTFHPKDSGYALVSDELAPPLD
ncbi:hypothetical protein ACFY5D_07880 [Paeniglutamicibacter sp. NPDC012692]|uniref:hypothetical protein n=1 Tax=Paeniglutamicibacter sp. NPDC012692 TaxID=3364388 RepID=UPI0036762134